MSAARHRAPIETPRLSLARMLLTALVIGATLVGGGLVASCGEEGSDPVPQTDGPQYGVRDSAGGGNGIRSHVLIGVQGVP